MGCCGSSTSAATAAGVVLGPVHSNQQQQVLLHAQPTPAPAAVPNASTTTTSANVRPPSERKGSIGIQKANAKYREGLSFSDGFFAAYECCVVDNAIKQLAFQKLVGEDYGNIKCEHKIDLLEGRITHIGGGFELQTNFQPVVFVRGSTTQLLSVSDQKEEMSSMLAQFEMLHKTLLQIFPDATELTMLQKTWATPLEANTFGELVSVMFAYAMGPTYSQAFMRFDDAMLFYCHKNPGLMPYPPDQTPEETIILLSKGLNQVRCLPMDATTVINGWFRSASTYGIHIGGIELTTPTAKQYLEMSNIFHLYAETYSTWEWTMYTIKVDGCKKEIRLLVRPRPDGTNTIEVIFTIETD